mmetsp:Transcript_14876/g.26851  ORF Transcript_14876/g.26851 Transcript_14876/m.26851 type:complete len:706 (-) Transcript_14876:65-2182(-)
MKLLQHRCWRGRDTLSALTPLFLALVQVAAADAGGDAGSIDAFPGVDAEPPSELALPSVQESVSAVPVAEGFSKKHSEHIDKQHDRLSSSDTDPNLMLDAPTLKLSGQNADESSSPSATVAPVSTSLHPAVPTAATDTRSTEQMHELVGELDREQTQQDALIELQSQKVHLDQQVSDFSQGAQEPDFTDSHAVPAGTAIAAKLRERDLGGYASPGSGRSVFLETGSNGGSSLQDVVAEEDDGSSKAEARFKDDSIQSALAYIGNRLKSDAQKNLRLRQMAAQSLDLKRTLQSENLELGQKRKEVAMLQLRLSDELQKEAHENSVIKAQHSHLRSVEQHLANASDTVDHHARALKWADQRLAAVQKTNTDLRRMLDAATASNQELSREFSASNSSNEAGERSLRKTSAQLRRTQETLRKTQAQLHALQATKADEDERLRRSERRERQSDKLDKLANRELSLLTQRLGSEEALEEHHRQSWSKEREALAQEVQALRANATESHDSLQRATSQARGLRKEVSLLKRRVWDGDQARQQAVRAQESLKMKLQEALTELGQLRGLVPRLQDEIERQKLATQNATEQAREARLARQDLKASLATSQRIIMQLQSQYADALQVLVPSQAESPSVQSPMQQPPAQPQLTHLPTAAAAAPTSLALPSQFLAPQPARQGQQDRLPAAAAGSTPELQLKLDSQGLRTLIMGLTGGNR